MPLLFVFNNQIWTKTEVVTFLHKNNIKYQLRHGFKFFISICKSHPTIESITSQKRIIVIDFTKSANLISALAIILENTKYSTVPTERLLKTEVDLGFDLNNFGYGLIGGINLEVLSNDVTTSSKEGIRDIILIYDCGDIIGNASIPIEARKIALDIFTLTATSLQVLADLVLQRELL